MAASRVDDFLGFNLRWTHRGGSLDELLKAEPEAVPLVAPAPDEVIARVEAVSICSSDIKVVRMGADHPLLANASNGEDTVLGHELCLRVEYVGSAQSDRFHIGQRLALQPAMRIEGKRQIVGFDIPGGFAQYLRLGPRALADYVFDAPETVSAATIALLEPYGCVERAYRPNARQKLDPAGTALIVLGAGADRYQASKPLRWQRTIVAGPPDAQLPESLGKADIRVDSLAEVADQRFDDIIALGEIGASDLALLPPLLAEHGVLLQARLTTSAPVPVDAARIHYDALAFLGTAQNDILAALDPARQRFDVRPGGVALIHGAGGAMGRIHVHRLLQLENGPGTVIATSRKGSRLAALKEDFAPMAEAQGRRLIVAEAEEVEALISELAPAGLDDVVIVVPDSAAVEAAARWLAPDGLLAVFAGFAFGRPIQFDLAGVATSGRRLTGSTGCSVEDMKDVLARVTSGQLDLLANLKAVGGLKALPKALDAVSRGSVSGKIVIYPQSPDMPFRAVDGGWGLAEERGLIAQSEPEQGR